MGVGMRHEVSASGDAFQFGCGGVWVWGGEGKLQEESAESSSWW